VSNPIHMANPSPNLYKTRLDPNSTLLTRPIAHRGLHGDSNPQNSMAAFAAAIAADVPIELDVWQLTDGAVAVFHDHDLEYLTGESGRIYEVDTPRLSTLRLAGTQEPVPLLSEVLDFVGGRVPLLIEVKCRCLRVGSLEAALVERLSGYTGELAIQSFNPLSVLWLKQHAPHLLRGQLAGGPIGVPFLVQTAPDFIAYQVGALPQPSVTAARAAGIPVLAWTVRSARALARAELEADNIICERADGFAPF